MISSERTTNKCSLNFTMEHTKTVSDPQGRVHQSSVVSGVPSDTVQEALVNK